MVHRNLWRRKSRKVNTTLIQGQDLNCRVTGREEGRGAGREVKYDGQLYHKLLKIRLDSIKQKRLYFVRRG